MACRMKNCKRLAKKYFGPRKQNVLEVLDALFLELAQDACRRLMALYNDVFLDQVDDLLLFQDVMQLLKLSTNSGVGLFHSAIDRHSESLERCDELNKPCV